MKKIFAALAIVAFVFMNAVPTLAETTSVTFTGKSEDEKTYTLTVPSTLNPVEDENEGTVTLEGSWASTVSGAVTADETITLVNNLNLADTKTLDVTFAGIEILGDNTGADVSGSADISIAELENSDKLFGTWSGILNYNVSFSNKSVPSTAKDASDNPVAVTSVLFVGSQKETMRQELVTAGSIEEDADVVIVNVNAAGTGSRTVELDLTDIAEPNAVVALYHKGTSGWESLGEFTTDENCKITFTSSSFSPFACDLDVLPWYDVDISAVNTENLSGPVFSINFAAEQANPNKVEIVDATHAKVKQGYTITVETSGYNSDTTAGTHFKGWVVNSVLDDSDAQNAQVQIDKTKAFTITADTSIVAKWTMGGCFVAGTKITMFDGSLKNIEDVVVGDRVLSYDIDNDKFYATTVIATGSEVVGWGHYEITLANGMVVRPTANHPLLTEDGFKTLVETIYTEVLTLDDVLMTVEGPSPIVSIVHIDADREVVYWINVKDDDEDEDNDKKDTHIADGVIAHNGFFNMGDEVMIEGDEGLKVPSDIPTPGPEPEPEPEPNPYQWQSTH